jgi:hypothetical protein
MSWPRYDIQELLKQDPYSFGSFESADGDIHLYEHPEAGDEAPTIAVSFKYWVAWSTGFYEVYPTDQDYVAEQLEEIIMEMVAAQVRAKQQGGQ